MRRFGAVARQLARHHTLTRAPISCLSDTDQLFSKVRHCKLSSRHFSTQFAQDPSEGPSPLPKEQPTGPSPPTTLRKRGRPSRVTDLYNVLVYEDGGATQTGMWRKVMAVDSAGAPVPEAESDLLRDGLEDCRQFTHAERSIALLDEAVRNGRTPTARAVIMAIEACLPAEEYQLAESALGRLDSLPIGHPARSGRLVTSARSVIAFSYTASGRHEDALRVMGLGDFHSIDWQSRGVVTDRLDGLRLGRDTVAWGVLVKALTKLKFAEAAVNVVDIAMGQGVSMTDSLLHLTLDALRALERTRQAEWLFDEAVRKGVVPRERTIASLLLTLTAKSARRSLKVTRIEELVDMIAEPSFRFKSTALIALTTAGSLGRSEKLFESMTKEAVPSEHAFAALMAGYGNHMDAGWESGGAEKDTTLARTAVIERADSHWGAYLEAYGGTKASNAQLKRLRATLVHRYLRVKTRCYELEGAVAVLEQLAAEKFAGLKLTSGHVSGVLGAAELACDVSEMSRVVRIMEMAGLRHDVRTLTYCVGTYIGDGNLGDALKLIRTEAPRLLADGYTDSGLRDYHWALLGRRLDMLSSAMKDAGGSNVKDLETFTLLVKAKHDSSCNDVGATL